MSGNVHACSLLWLRWVAWLEWHQKAGTPPPAMMAEEDITSHMLVPQPLIHTKKIGWQEWLPVGYCCVAYFSVYPVRGRSVVGKPLCPRTELGHCLTHSFPLPRLVLFTTVNNSVLNYRWNGHLPLSVRLNRGQVPQSSEHSCLMYRLQVSLLVEVFASERMVSTTHWTIFKDLLFMVNSKTTWHVW